jgi:hypothetical protein
VPVSTAHILYRWGRYNTLAPTLARMGAVSYLKVSYDALSGRSEETMARVGRFVGAPASVPGRHDREPLPDGVGPGDRGPAAWSKPTCGCSRARCRATWR